MSSLHRRNQQLWMEDVSLQELAVEHSTPCYVYSKRGIEANFLAYEQGLAEQKHLVCFAVKANSNIAVLQILARLGAGFDIVSIGELERVILAGGSADKIVFSGVGKTAAEMCRALEVGIRCFNVESHAELLLLNETAGAMGCVAPISLRVNPDVDPLTHPYISTGLKENKFGIDIAEAEQVYQLAATLKNLRIVGIDCHIGSPITEIDPFVEALEHLLDTVDKLGAQGIKLQHVDVGGGLGVRYQDEQPPKVAAYLSALLARFRQRSETLVLEPGRSITADAGCLITQVQYIKTNGGKHFAMVDAGMNDLLRPALYEAWMDIQPLLNDLRAPTRTYDVVGPVCETGDFLGQDRSLSIESGDFLCVYSAGAYGFTMSSNYNSRPRAAEIVISGAESYVVRARETIQDLTRGEQLLPEERSS